MAANRFLMLGYTIRLFFKSIAWHTYMLRLKFQKCQSSRFICKLEGLRKSGLYVYQNIIIITIVTEKKTLLMKSTQVRDTAVQPVLDLGLS